MVLKRKLPTDMPAQPGASDVAPQQEAAAAAAPQIQTPPPVTSFDNFDEIPEPTATAEPRPMGGPAIAPVAEAVAEVAASAPTSSGGLKRRMPAPAPAAPAPAAPAPAAPVPQSKAPAPQKAAPAVTPILDEDPLVADSFMSEEPDRYLAEPTPMATTQSDDLSWMSQAPEPINTAIPATPDDDEWEMGVEATSSYDQPIPASEAPVYGNLGRADDPFAVAPAAPEKPATTQRPWEQNAGAGPAPTLPKTPFAGAKAEGNGRTFITLGLLGVLGVGAYMFITNRDSAVDAMSRWTGTLSNVSQNVADTPGENTAGLIQADEVISSKDVGIAPLQPAFGDQQIAMDDSLPAPTGLNDMGNTTVDFVDVPPSQKNEPIMADGSEPMPEEVSAFAALHEAIMEKRAERDAKKAVRRNQDTGEPIPPALADQVAETKPRLNTDVDRDLEAYRRVLASIDNPAMKPSPSDFFADPGAYDSGLLPPPGIGMPAEKPTKTPEGNPIISSEVQRTASEKTVRTLADFEDALMKQPEKQVRIPSKVKPRLATSGFPELEILSLIPTYGLLANASDRQGVLLIGDTFEGWELVGVYDTYAEFQSGDRKHVVTLK